MPQVFLWKKTQTDIQRINQALSAAISSINLAKNLLKELFTIKGHGTFIRYHKIISTRDSGSINKKKIKFTLEDSFEKSLVKITHHFIILGK